VQDFRQLKIWKRSHELTLSVYRASAEFPREERYGLTSQIRRSSSSIPTNIAEGSGRSTGPDFLRFLDIAFASACELEYQLLLAHDLSLLTSERYESLAKETTELKRMMARFMQSLEPSKSSPRTEN
jgi:four helix bundle protein